MDVTVPCLSEALRNGNGGVREGLLFADKGDRFNHNFSYLQTKTEDNLN